MTDPTPTQLRAALAWPTGERPTPMPLCEHWEQHKASHGWCVNIHRATSYGRPESGVYEAWQTRSTHYTTNPKKDSHSSGSRQLEMMYHTKVDALRELQWRLCEQAARQLAEVEEAIHAEAAKQEQAQ